MDFGRVARLCRWVLDRLLAWGLHAGQLVNVNIPVLGPDRPRGVRIVPQSTAGVEDSYHRHEHPEGLESYRLGESFNFAPAEGPTDVACLEEGYITVTPLKVDMTDRERLAELADASKTWPCLPAGRPGRPQQ